MKFARVIERAEADIGLPSGGSEEEGDRNNAPASSRCDGDINVDEVDYSKVTPKASAVPAHPKTAIKNKVTNVVVAQLSTLHTPYILQAAETEFIAAHDALGTAADKGDLGSVVDAEGKLKALKKKKKKRKSMRIALTTGRHVARVRRVPARRERPRKEFVVKDERRRIVRRENGTAEVD